MDFYEKPMCSSPRKDKGNGVRISEKLMEEIILSQKLQMEDNSITNYTPENVDDASSDLKRLFLDNLSVPSDLHFSFSSIKLKYDDEIHKLSDEKDKENQSQDQHEHFDDDESISISLRVNESELQLDQQYEPRSEFSFSSLDSNEFSHGIDSILITKRRASRNLQSRGNSTSNDSWLNESYESTLSLNRADR